MLIPKINPDEFGPGYLIRLGLVNGLKSQKDVLKRILHHYPNITEHRTLPPYLLSVVLGMSTEEYCQEHSLLPIYRSISNSALDLAHGSIQNLYGLQRWGHFAKIKYLKVCKSCINEDLDFLGYSYYRRSHQIPGVMCCTKHGPESGYLYSAPLENFCNPDQINNAQLTLLEQQDNQYISRILTIMDGLCEIKEPTDPISLIPIMQSKAKELGYKWFDRGRSELFSDMVIQHLPIDWLENLGINLDSKIRGKRSGKIDGALSPQKAPFQALVYIVVLGMLFEDADQVLTLIRTVKSLPIQKVRTLRKFDPKYWESDDFFRLYLSKGGNATEIARHVGVTDELIWRGLKIAKLPTIGLYKNGPFKAFKLFQNGHSLQDAASASGVPIDKLEAIVRVVFSRVSNFGEISTKNELSQNDEADIMH